MMDFYIAHAKENKFKEVCCPSRSTTRYMPCRKKGVALHHRTCACARVGAGGVLQCCTRHAMSDKHVLPLSQVTTFDIAEFNATITDPSWFAAYGQADGLYQESRIKARVDSGMKYVHLEQKDTNWLRLVHPLQPYPSLLQDRRCKLNLLVAVVLP